MPVSFVAKYIKVKTGTLQFDNVPAILAMVSANLGISLVQLSDLGICQLYPVRVVQLGLNAPVSQFALVTRKADEDNRALAVVREALVPSMEHDK